MSNEGNEKLTEDERDTSQALLESLGLDLPSELEWDANSRVSECRSIPSLGLEMRYSARQAGYDERCAYHYWSYTRGEHTLVMVVAQEDPEYLRECAEPGEEDEISDALGFSIVSFGALSREDVLTMDIADTVELDEAVCQLSESDIDPLNVVIDRWLQNECTSDVVWLFLSHQLQLNLHAMAMADEQQES